MDEQAVDKACLQRGCAAATGGRNRERPSGMVIGSEAEYTSGIGEFRCWPGQIPTGGLRVHACRKWWEGCEGTHGDTGMWLDIKWIEQILRILAPVRHMDDS